MTREHTESFTRLSYLVLELRREYSSSVCLGKSGKRCIHAGRTCAGCFRVWLPEIDDVEPGNVYERCRECGERLLSQAAAECVVCANKRVLDEAMAWLESIRSKAHRRRV